MRAPDHVILATDHPYQASLSLLDPSLELRFNTKLTRYEVWRHEIHSILLTPMLTFLRRIEHDGRFAEPGEWFSTQLRARDGRHNSAKNIVKLVGSEIDAFNAKITADADKTLADQLEAMTLDHLQAWRHKVGDGIQGRQYLVDGRGQGLAR